MFINYAHRGASAYAPENTMTAFRLGIKLGANGIETDVRKTKDGIPVLFHDAGLLRLTGTDRLIADMTLKELSGIKIPSPDGALTDTVPTLEEFLSFVKDQPAAVALELKDDGLEAVVIAMTAASGIADRCVVTSFSPEHLAIVKALAPEMKVGLLTDAVDEDVVSGLKKIGAEQICPKASVLTPELVRSLHKEGFCVRAWGIRDEEMMKEACRCGVDGMTVNFPDKLDLYLRQNNVIQD